MAIKYSKWDPNNNDKCTPEQERACNNQNKAGTGILLQKNALRWSALAKKEKTVSSEQFRVEKPIDLEQRITRKILELVDKEETLVDLYKKAAEAAKKKEEDFKNRTAALMKQIEKDKTLVDILKRVN